jgi:hypothetical protein
MSALPPKADIACGQLDVRIVPEADIAALFVVADAATLVTDACHIGFLWNGLARSGLREVVVLYNNATYRCGFSGVVLSLPKWRALENRVLDLLGSGQPLTISAEGKSYVLPPVKVRHWRARFQIC